MQMYQMSKKVMRQSKKIPAQENASINKIAKRMAVQMNLLPEKNSRRKQLPKKKLWVKHTNCNFLLKLYFFKMNKSFCTNQRRIVKV